MVEFAIALPVLLLLLYGILEAGRLLFVYSTVVTASRQAARYGATTGENGSGELLMAFSTTYRPQLGSGTNSQTVIEGVSVNDLFAAAVDATEEAVLNSLCMATTTTGRYGRVVDALPLDRVRTLLAQAGRIGSGL